MKPHFLSETNWEACNGNTQWCNQWEHAYSVMMDIPSMCFNNTGTENLSTFKMTIIKGTRKDNFYSVLQSAST
jgi:hypothetical protein